MPFCGLQIALVETNPPQPVNLQSVTLISQPQRFMWLCVCIFVYMHIHMCVFIYTYVSVCVCVWCMYMYLFVFNLGNVKYF